MQRWQILILFISDTLLVEATSFAKDNHCRSVEDKIAKAIHHFSDLSSARWLALEALGSCEEETLRRRYQLEADAFFQDPKALKRIDRAISSQRTDGPTAAPHRLDAPNCWNVDKESYQKAPDLWDLCCSHVPSINEQKLLLNPRDSIGFAPEIQTRSSPTNTSDSSCRRADGSYLCCHFRQGTASYLRLPALREVDLVLELNDSLRLLLEQDGFLRQFDVSGILWPTAYLLSLCLANAQTCGISRFIDSALSGRHPSVLELGAGIAAPLITVAKQMQHRFKQDLNMVATDKAPQALALTLANANAANVTSILKTELLDHYNHTQVESFQKRHQPGFSVILGSALQHLYDVEDNYLWTLLDLLIDHTNPNSLVVLTHSCFNGLPPLNNILFERVRNLSGDIFGMIGRTGEPSCFEVSAFVRRQTEITPPDL